MSTPLKFVEVPYHAEIEQMTSALGSTPDFGDVEWRDTLEMKGGVVLKFNLTAKKHFNDKATRNQQAASLLRKCKCVITTKDPTFLSDGSAWVDIALRGTTKNVFVTLTFVSATERRHIMQGLPGRRA